LSNSILIKESSIVIFTSFVAVAKEIHHKLEDMDWAGELLTGETAPKKRQAMVDRFQTCISPVFVCTYGAGGVGLTLTGERSFKCFSKFMSFTINNFIAMCI
jgi:SNF2 family DNA or RNA helicase